MSSPFKIRILLPCPTPLPGKTWGDWYFAKSLGNAFNALGVKTRYAFCHKKKKRQFLEKLKRRFSINEVDFVIRGKEPYEPLNGKPFFMWVISQISKIETSEIEKADHVFIASEKLANHFKELGLPVTFVPQCTDPKIFSPDKYDSELETDVLFVGNRRTYAERPVVQMALNNKANLSVWGRKWQGELPEGVYKGEMIENNILGAYYASANVVLNDHTHDMVEGGLVSNRVYDVLACGTPILTEKMDSLPQDLIHGMYLYEDNESFERGLFSAQNEDAEKQEMRLHLAENVKQNHSFDNRARQMLDVMKRVIAEN